MSPRRVVDGDAPDPAVKKTGTRRKAAAPSAKDSSKPKAGTAARKPPVRKGEPRTNIERGIRDMLLLRMAGEGATNAEIAAVDGRSIQQVKRVREAYEKHGVGGAIDLERDPVKIVEEMLDRAAMTWRIAAEMALDAKHENARIGALRLMMQADERQQDILQSLGKLPKELGTLRHVIDIRAIAVNLLDVLDRVEKGEMEPSALRETLKQMMGVGTRPLPALPSAD